MAILPGTRVGPYEVLSAIGAGGMGEVYRARDSKLGRDVAIKVLPQAFARDAERMARFQREAKVLGPCQRARGRRLTEKRWSQHHGAKNQDQTARQQDVTVRTIRSLFRHEHSLLGPLSPENS